MALLFIATTKTFSILPSIRPAGQRFTFPFVWHFCSCFTKSS